MKQTINEHDFIEAFRNYNRLQTDETSGNFTREGATALFEYLKQYEDDTGEELELDVIALCCDYAEYADFKELYQDYGHLIKNEDFTDEEEKQERIIEELEANTTLIEIDKEEGHVIIQSF